MIFDDIILRYLILQSSYLFISMKIISSKAYIFFNIAKHNIIENNIMQSYQRSSYLFGLSGHVVLLQLSPQVLAFIASHFIHPFPEFNAVVHLFGMAQFVQDDVIDQGSRQQHQVER